VREEILGLERRGWGRENAAVKEGSGAFTQIIDSILVGCGKAEALLANFS